MWYIYTLEDYSAIKNYDLMDFADEGNGNRKTDISK